MSRLVAASPVVLALLALAAAAFLGWSIPGSGPRPRLADFTFDLLNRLAPRPAVPLPVRIVDIDEASLARLGQWPWPRTRLAEIVERLRGAGAAAIAFDIVFSEPDRTSPAEAARTWSVSSDLRQRLASLPDHDSVFAAAIGGGKVVTGFIATNNPDGTNRPAVKASAAFTGSNNSSTLPRFSDALTTLAPIEAAAAGNGAFNFVQGEDENSDGIVRRVPLLLRIGDEVIPTIVTEALRVAAGAHNYFVASDETGGISSVRVGRLTIPTDRSGAVSVHFREVPAGELLPAWRILAETPPTGIKGSIVFIGTSAPGLLDLRYGPLGQLPGVELHSLAVEQILSGEFLSRPGWADGAELLFLLLAGAVVIFLVLKAGPLPSAAATVGFAALGMIVTRYGFTQHQLLLEPFYPALALVAVFLAAFVPQQFLAEREGRWIRRAFSSYVSPNLVEHLIAHPEQLRLGGERRECSFVLTDIAGFTQLVESSDPATLVGLLNDYLDGMVKIAFRHEGTLDKVVGDAVAVMFSAPLVQPDHAQRAVACALDMDRFAQDFARERRAQGQPLGVTRIGVNTGSVIVGNVGGQTLDYRPLGDAINTSSRLETINKTLGTRICVSNTTAEQCPGFAGRPVGLLLLVGKSEEILAWEPLPPERQAAPEIAAYRAAYALMETGDPEAPAAFARLADSDPLARFHAERLARGETGVRVTLQTK